MQRLDLRSAPFFGEAARKSTHRTKIAPHFDRFYGDHAGLSIDLGIAEPIAGILDAGGKFMGETDFEWISGLKVVLGQLH